MNRKNLSDSLASLHVNSASITDPETKSVVIGLLNLVESLQGENEKLKQENQQLKDEVNRLKGEQGKPKIKGKNRKGTNISSEEERKAGSDNKDKDKHPKKKRARKAKIPKIKVDREQCCPIDKNALPTDAIFKGYSDVVIQDIKIVTDNVKYRREAYYSPSTGKTYLGNLPDDVTGKGEFGVGIRALIPLLKSECGMSERCILDFFQNFGIHMSSAYLSNQLSSQWTKGYDFFHQEKSELFLAGLASGSYQQIDDTGARVNGENQYTHVLCSPYYSAYFTTKRKDRLTVLAILRNFAPPEFLYNSHAIRLLEAFKLSKKFLRLVDEHIEKETVFDELSFDALVNTFDAGPQQRTRLKEACAIAAYRQQTQYPIIETLVCDDAPQFKRLTQNLALCWVHDGRHYKKLLPIVAQHKAILKDFLGQYWDFYHELNAYKQAPTATQAALLAKTFDELFSTKTDYEQLNDRIAKTLAKRTELLLVLDHPELPLHNNESELAARVQARARDVSLHTKSDKGTKIKDTMMTISQTAKKLGIRTYEYIYDRVSGNFKLPSLAQVILEKSQSVEIAKQGGP